MTREEDTREELAECREKLHKTKQHYEQKLLAAQKRRTEAEAAHEEVGDGVRGTREEVRGIWEGARSKCKGERVCGSE